jgi:hypothetical protein
MHRSRTLAYVGLSQPDLICVRYQPEYNPTAHTSTAHMKKWRLDMKSLSILGSAISIMVFAALNTAAMAGPKGNPQAESMEYQCRAAARAELKGPDCRMWMPDTPTSHCNIPTQTEVHIYDNKTLECVRRGGPGRQSKAGA